MTWLEAVTVLGLVCVVPAIMATVYLLLRMLLWLAAHRGR